MFKALSPGAIGVQTPTIESAIAAARLGGFTGVEISPAQIADRIDRALHCGRSAAEVAAFDAGVNVDHALDVVMVDDRGFDVLAQRRNVGEQLLAAIGARRHRRRQRRVAQRVHRVVQMLRHLLEHAVVDAVGKVEPVGRLDQDVGREPNQQVGRHRPLIDPELERLDPIDIDANRRIVQQLRDAHVLQPWYPFHPVLQPQRDLIIRLQVQARNLRVDGRR